MTSLTDDAVSITAAGEALIDLVQQADGRYLACEGGAVFNLSRALARQGLGVAYLNPLSADRFGRQLPEHQRSTGVHHQDGGGQTDTLQACELDWRPQQLGRKRERERIHGP